MKTESTLIMVISVILLPFLIFSGCGRRDVDTNNGFFWEPVDPEVDSLVAQFDTLFNGSHNGRLADVLATRLDSFAQYSDNPSVRARAYYFCSVYHKHRGERERSAIYLDSALKLSDPKAHPYEYAVLQNSNRYHSLMWQHTMPSYSITARYSRRLAIAIM